MKKSLMTFFFTLPFLTGTHQDLLSSASFPKEAKRPAPFLQDLSWMNSSFFNVLMNLGCTDIIEHPTQYMIKIDVPGIEKKDLKVFIQNGILVIEATRTQENLVKDIQEGKVKIISQERQMNEFMRSFSLPTDINPDLKKIHAKLEGGVLEITLPRLPKKIEEIKVN